MKKYLKMKKIISLAILPSLIFTFKRKSTSIDINNETKQKKNLLGDYLAIYDSNTVDQTKKSLLGYVILNNLYF